MKPQDEKALEDIKEAVLGLVRLFKVGTKGAGDAFSIKPLSLLKPVSLGGHGWEMRLARCLSPLSLKLSLVGRGL